MHVSLYLLQFIFYSYRLKSWRCTFLSIRRSRHKLYVYHAHVPQNFCFRYWGHFCFALRSQRLCFRLGAQGGPWGGIGGVMMFYHLLAQLHSSSITWLTQQQLCVFWYTVINFLKLLLFIDSTREKVLCILDPHKEFWKGSQQCIKNDCSQNKFKKYKNNRKPKKEKNCCSQPNFDT